MRFNPRQREIIVQERGMLIFYVLSALFATFSDAEYRIWLALAMWSAAFGAWVTTSLEVLAARETESVPGLLVPEPASNAVLGWLDRLFGLSTLGLATVVLVLQVSAWLDLSLPSLASTRR